MTTSELQVTRLPTHAADVPLQHELRSTYHIYHEKENHQCISTQVDHQRERLWGPTIKHRWEKHRAKKLKKKHSKDGIFLDQEKASESGDTESLFLHKPYLAFHNPPRVLYGGDTKQGKPLLLIHGSFLWRKWRIQLGPSLATPGVLDPRGVVCWRHNGGNREALKADDTKLKGYKVRNWRLWGEQGKEYVHRVKTARKAGGYPDPDLLENELEAQNTAARANEVAYLKWMSPFWLDTRRYQFYYAGIDFYWKGTGTVRDSRTCGILVHFNHLKLVAKAPSTESMQKDKGSSQLELCLGKYTSSIAAEKSGILELYDGAIWRLIEEHIPSTSPPRVGSKISSESKELCASEDEKGAQVKRTPLYCLIVATAMCMIIGERQKRKVLRLIFEMAASEGSNAG